MKTNQDSCVKVIGVGNTQRSDDGVGIAFVRNWRDAPAGVVALAEHCGDGTALMESWRGADNVILIDAVSSGVKPGTIHRIEAHARPVPREFSGCSSHWFGVAWAIEMARVMGTLPRRFIVYGIEAESFAVGEGLSAPVAEAAQKLQKLLRQEITRRAKSCTNMR